MTPSAPVVSIQSRARRGAGRAAKNAAILRTLSVILGGFILVAAILSIDASGFAATSYLYTASSTLALWNTSASWTPNNGVDYPGSQPGDTAVIVTGTVNVNTPVPNPLAGLTVANGTINLNTTSGVTTTPGDALVVAGTFDFQGGQLTFDPGQATVPGSMGITASGLLNMNNSGGTVLGAVLNNAGTINYEPVGGASLSLDTTGAIHNSGAFNLNNDAQIGSVNPVATPGTIHNGPGATLTKTAGATPGGQTISPSLTNDGVVSVQAGRLRINGDGSVLHSGQFTIASTSTLEFQTGSHILSNASFPSSTPSITGGEVQVDGPQNSPAFLLIGGSGDSGGAIYDVSRTTLPGGALDPNNPTIAAKTDFLDMNSLGTINGFGDFLLRLSGSFTGGQILGHITNHFTVAPAATLTINPTTFSDLIADITFVNQGRVNYVTGTSQFILFSSNTFIHNDAGAIWDLQGDNQLPSAVGFGTLRTKPDAKAALRTQPAGGPSPPSEFFNDGLLEKTATNTLTSTTDIDIHLTNTGTIDVLAGTINFGEGMTQTAGTTTLENGSPTVPAVSSPTGQLPPVSIMLNGGTLTGAGAVGGDLLNNSATILPGTPTTTGAIAVTGNYTQGSPAALTLKLASTSSFDKLNTTGSDALSGTLNLQSLGGYTAPNGASFAILNYASETGAFGTINPIGLNASFSVTYGPNTATATAIVPAISINNVTANEGNAGTTPFTFTVTLSAPSGQTVTVNYATQPVTATDGVDYTDVNGTLTFAPGVTTETITVPVFGDTTSEPDETFHVNLSAPSNATLAVATGTGTIVNDDATAPALSINNVSQAEGNSGTTPFVFTVTLSSASTQTVSVSFATANGSATAGSDYVATSGTLTFAPGVTTQTITVPVTGDTVNEADETFIVTLSAPSNATITTPSGVGTIVNDDTGCGVGPTNLFPLNNAQQVPTDGVLQWSASANATSYNVFLGSANGCSTAFGVTKSTSLPYSNLTPNTVYQWRVEAVSPSCPVVSSFCQTFTTAAATSTCTVPDKPVITAPGEATTGQPYFITWTSTLGVTNFDLQESPTPDFSGPLVKEFRVEGTTSAAFQHDVVTATPFYYRVFGSSFCALSNAPLRTGPNEPPITNGPFSDVARVVVIPIPALGELNPDITTPVGSTTPIVQQFLIPGFPGQTWNFTTSTDEPWLSVDPPSGILPPNGVTLTVTADPTGLANGTHTGTAIVTLLSLTSGKSSTTIANDTAPPPPPVNTPVSINVVTPVTPISKTAPPANTLIIPAVGHVSGADSKWQSDIRLANTGAAQQKYQLTFTPSGTDARLSSKSTIITAAPGATIALDDIVKRWYGLGSLNDGVSGALEIRPVTVGTSIGGRPGTVTDDISISAVTVASSRTYNTTPNGTLGQFIPALPFTGFVGLGSSTLPSSILSLQQIAQSAAYRTNFGIVEGAGQPVSVLANIFDSQAHQLASVPITLKAGEMQQIDNFLGKANVSELADGRIEVSVVSGAGRVMTYASVVDNTTNDPLLINGQIIGQTLSRNFVIPGVADLNTGLASWRTDMRIFNSGAPTEATLTFYPQDSPGTPTSKTVTVNTNEVRSLDNLLQSEFGVTNVGGALHVTTVVDSPLIVSARTYNQTTSGTFGQFVPAVTAADAVGAGERSLNILQVEDSDRFRTNLGLTEVTGQPATVEVSAIFSDSKVTPKVTFQLPANGFVQTRLLNMLGLSHTQTYNARLSIRVTAGTGKVAAYGSVIDAKTEDPTYVPAQ